MDVRISISLTRSLELKSMDFLRHVFSPPSVKCFSDKNTKGQKRKRKKRKDQGKDTCVLTWQVKATNKMHHGK
jgi:hypothetical protein